MDGVSATVQVVRCIRLQVHGSKHEHTGRGVRETPTTQRKAHATSQGFDSVLACCESLRPSMLTPSVTSPDCVL